MRHPKNRSYLQLAHNWISQFIDPIRAAKMPARMLRYLDDWHRYARMPSAEKTSFTDSMPQVHDRHSRTPVDRHYFYANRWAMCHILTKSPVTHIDVGSQTMFANLLSTVVPVIFMDFRPLEVAVPNLDRCGGDILNLPFADESIDSLSCLHVAEHVGLGRYGEPLNPNGTREACNELKRVLKLGGNLYFCVPIGIPRVCFNAHRIHRADTVLEYFSGLELVEFSGVDDRGNYLEHLELNGLRGEVYGCGLFWLRKPASLNKVKAIQ